jgi:hypothetical protein
MMSVSKSAEDLLNLLRSRISSGMAFVPYFTSQFIHQQIAYGLIAIATANTESEALWKGKPSAFKVCSLGKHLSECRAQSLGAGRCETVLASMD